jgi:hypothetical protein
MYTHTRTGTRHQLHAAKSTIEFCDKEIERKKGREKTRKRRGRGGGKWGDKSDQLFI